MPNDFLTFAGDPIANVLPQVDYLSPTTSPWRLGGFTAGTAISPNLNKVWRQASIVSSMIAQFIEDNTGLPSIDDGTIATLQANFGNSVLNFMRNQVSGFLPLTGGTLTGDLEIDSNDLIIRAPTADATMIMDRVLGQPAQLVAQSAGRNRWVTAFADGAPETGNNLGSNWALARFNDAGDYVDTPLYINRNSGVVDFLYPPTIRGGNLPYVPISGNVVMTGNLGVGGAGLFHPGMGLWSQHAFGWNGYVNMYVDGTYVGDIASTGYVNSVAGNYLPISGGQVNNWLGVNGGFDCYGGGGFHSSVYFGNVGDFSNFSGGAYRYRQWAGGWYDYWDGNNGNRVWQTPGGGYMLLDGGASLYCSGVLHSDGARIMSIGAYNNPSVSVWNTPYGCAGMWYGGDGLWFGSCDGSGNPVNGWLRLSTDGQLTVWSHINAVNDLTSGNGLVRMSGTGIIFAALSWNRWNFRWDGRTVFIRVDDWWDREIIWGDGNFRVHQLGMSGITMYWQDADYSGWFANTYRSDRVFKDNIVDAPDFDSLGAIRQVPIRSFDRIDHPEAGHTPFGVIGDELAAAIPDAVDYHEVWKGKPLCAHLNLASMVTHLFKAVQQLAEQVDELRRAHA